MTTSATNVKSQATLPASALCQAPETVWTEEKTEVAIVAIDATRVVTLPETVKASLPVS